MQRIVLIGCGKRKARERTRARDLYQGPLFKASLHYAFALNPRHIFILSAKHGLVGLDDSLAPYNQTLYTMTDRDVRAWAERALVALREEADLERDEFVILAGERYRKYLVPHLAHHREPLAGMGIGRQLQFLKQHAADVR